MAPGEEYLTTDYADFRRFQKAQIALISNRGWGGFPIAVEERRKDTNHEVHEEHEAERERKAIGTRRGNGSVTSKAEGAEVHGVRERRA